MRRALLGVIAAAMAGVLAYDLFLAVQAYQTHAVVQRRGFTCRRLTDSTGYESRYVVFVPHGPPPGPDGYPVLLFLNGFGENGEDGTRQLSRNLGIAVWETKGRFPFVVVAPQCRKGGAWTDNGPDARRALETLEEVIQTHGCDRDRVFVTGPSSGGAGVLAVAAAHPDLFAAIIPLCAPSTGRYSSEEATRLFAEAKLPVWSLYNEGDGRGLVAFNRSLREALLKQGASPMWTEYDRQGHNCWEAAYRNPALYDWMLRQNRSANGDAPPFELLVGDSPRPGGAVAGDGSGIDGDDGVPREESVAETTASAVLTIERSLGDFELHFDCRLDGSGSGPGVIELAPADGAPSATARIVLELPEQGGGGVFLGTDGPCLAVCDPLAQRNLQAGRWNDIRIRSVGETLSVESNGWKLLECRDAALAGGITRVRLSAPGGGQAFRYLRLAEIPRGGTR